MIQLNVEVDSSEVETYLSKLPNQMFNRTKSAFLTALTNADRKTKQNATNRLKVRTGNLKRSIKFLLAGNEIKTLKGSLFTVGRLGGQSIVYAPIHEYGGTIRAKNAYKKVPGGPYLNIPTQENKTPAGVQRMTARMVFSQGGYIAGKGVYLNGKRMFSLVKKVKIPARLGMHDAAKGEIKTLLNELQNLVEE
ncbi:MAG: hypothetical protein DRO88_02535 [Promethearchaeia archaeon]|nr:MAG: hypothetical protein DRO88_02535 [Candidatus Lokiarchaeia archaeon]